MSRLFFVLLILSSLSFAQSWSGIVDSSRATDWSHAGLPATLPDGETTPNPWTPPTRTQQCGSTMASTSTAADINSRITSCASTYPNGSYILLGAGTFSLGGDISITVSNVTLRGSGPMSTNLTGGNITVSGGWWAGASLLTANPAKGATSITVASAPTDGRLAMIEQCDDGFSAANANYTNYGSGTSCTGAYSDPGGPWVCGLTASCDRSGGTPANPHFQAQVVWIPAGGISGNTVAIGEPLANGNWSTSRSAALTWLNVPGTVGVGLEDFTLVGSVLFSHTYACWLKGTRLITTSTNNLLAYEYDANSLAINNYIASTAGGSSAELITWGADSGEKAQSYHLFLNNIIEGGYTFGMGAQTGHVWAYNYWYTAANSSWVENGDANHHAGTSFNLREGNQSGISQDDDTWGTHNFNTWFRNYISCTDPTVTPSNTTGLELGGWARFENLVGNALGGGGCSSSYAALIPVNARGLDTSGLTEASLMRWGNYALCSGADPHCNQVNWDSAEVPTNLSSFGANSTPYQNSVPANHNLPASFFMNSMTAHPNGGTGLSWWKTCTSWTTFPTSCAAYGTPPMPPIGPDVTGGTNINGYAYNIPAALAWANLPTDSSYATAWGHLKQFDERVYNLDAASPASYPRTVGSGRTLGAGHSVN